eukprot:TRINITY_DN10441_c0_g1_i1.p1 TRINITY_DN10441_c0_g1~~TRINITY_DN10441_c0_g1_i1.p1  ORF type:complete len:136 (-),score=5.51 TRINITY_DN10441_c0_g1_i1:35-442(-)
MRSFFPRRIMAHYTVYFISQALIDGSVPGLDVRVPVKVGFHKRMDEHRRIANLQTGNPCQLTFIDDVEFSDKDTMRRAETAAHQVLRGRHIRGEWFYLTAAEVDSVLVEVKQHTTFVDGVVDDEDAFSLLLENNL